ncbi:MAG: hypothetical protein DRH79_06045 [Candidatus Cloacimonadota bacterium]|nr:MAG: hypothetical protein DRH79_06045 [Candidatus Cloacimonadota bacterium]
MVFICQIILTVELKQTHPAVSPFEKNEGIIGCYWKIIWPKNKDVVESINEYMLIRQMNRFNLTCSFSVNRELRNEIINNFVLAPNFISDQIQ